LDGWEGEGFWVKGRDCGGFAGVFSGLWRKNGRYMKRPIPIQVAMLRRYMNRPIPDRVAMLRRYMKHPIPVPAAVLRRYMKHPIPVPAAVLRRYMNRPNQAKLLSM
jgi:hypothetical protein